MVQRYGIVFSFQLSVFRKTGQPHQNVIDNVNDKAALKNG